MDIILGYDADELFYEEDGVVSFELQSTLELDTALDGIRTRKGYAPFFDESAPNCWTNGWYEVYLEVDVFNRKIVDIVGVVKGNDADEEDCPDDEKYYRLGDYTSIDKDNIMNQLVTELRKRFHTSLDEIEKEVREYG